MATSSKEQLKYLITQNKGASLEKVIESLLSSDIYVTADFLQEPNIKELNHPAGSNKHYNTLYLFSNNTFKEYSNETSKYIQLTPKMLLKLKMLTVVELAKTNKLLTFEHLKDVLKLKENFELEQILFNVISKGLLTGRVNAKEGKVHIISVKPRKNLQSTIEAEEMIDKWIANIDEANKYIKNQENIIEIEKTLK